METMKQTRRSSEVRLDDPVAALEDLGSPQFDAARRAMFEHLKRTPKGREWIDEAFRASEGMPDRLGLTELYSRDAAADGVVQPSAHEATQDRQESCHSSAPEDDRLLVK